MSVSSDEVLARFIFSQRHVRPDKTVRPEAFLPHPYCDLSVVRHIGLSDVEVWAEGQTVSAIRQRRLHGRADFTASVPRGLGLDVVVADPPPRNHAVVIGWGPEKSKEMSRAQQISKEAIFYPPPADTARAD